MPYHLRKMAPWLLCLPLLCAGCAGSAPPPQVVTQFKTVVLTPPPSMLDCPEPPSPPDDAALGKWTQRDVATALTGTYSAAVQCRGQLGQVRDWTAQVQPLK